MVFSFLIFTEFRKSRTENILFLLDEPASNLHSSAQLKILGAIEALSDKAVIIYSTHSHHLIEPKWLNGAYVVINEAISADNLQGDLTDGDTKIHVDKYYNYVSKQQQLFQPLYFQPILDRLEYRRSFLEPTPKIIICEGKSDWYTFLYLSRVILNTVDLNFYPGKGAGNNFDIIRLYLSWGCDFLIVYDGDEPGEEKIGKYKKEFDNLLDNKAFSLASIVKHMGPMEDLFTVGDKRKLCDSAFGKGSYENVCSDSKRLKSTLNYAINHLMVKKQSVELESNTLDCFSTIFEFLSKRLK